MSGRTPTPSFPLDPYHAFYQAGPFYVDVRKSGVLKERVVVQLLSIREESPYGKTPSEFIELVIPESMYDRRRPDTVETKEGGR